MHPRGPSRPKTGGGDAAPEPDDWGEWFERIREATGWTYRDIAELTLPQARCLLHGGKEPVEKVTDAEAIRWARSVATGGPS